MEKALLSSGKDEWETPQDFFDELDKQYGFTLDPCATPENAKCTKYYTKRDDGLKQDWGGETVFCNPPYSPRTKTNPGQEAWIAKAQEESKKPGTTVVMLIPARTDTKAFHRHILPHAKIKFLPGRLRFAGAKHSAPFPSMLVIFGDKEA